MVAEKHPMKRNKLTHYVMMHGKLATYESLSHSVGETERLFLELMKEVTDYPLTIQDYYNMGYYIKQVSVQPATAPLNN